MVACNTQDYWDFGHFPLSAIPENRILADGKLPKTQ
jgi:hypothetical protein